MGGEVGVGGVVDAEVGVEETEVEGERVGVVGSDVDDASVVGDGLDGDGGGQPGGDVGRRGVHSQLRPVSPGGGGEAMR